MFKKSVLILSLMTLSSAALAVPVANLKVGGSITPPTCTVNGSETNDVLYTFNTAPGLFPASGNLNLDEQIKNIEVVCDATTYLAFDIADERTASVLTTGINNFGLGLYGESTKVGFYTVVIRNAQIKADKDAEAKTAYVKVGTATATTSAAYVPHTAKTQWTTSTGVSAPGQVFSADFGVRPTLNSELKNSDGTAELDGHAVLTFSFGV